MRLFVSIFFVLSLLFMGPLLSWPVLRASIDVGLVIGVGLIVVGQHRWAWAVVLLAATIDESRSVTPIGLQLVAAVFALALVIVAHRRLLSGHSQTQVSVLVLIAVIAKNVGWLLFRGLTIAFHGTWIIPTVQAIGQSMIPTLLWSVIATFLIWPYVSRRWLSLQRIIHGL